MIQLRFQRLTTWIFIITLHSTISAQFASDVPNSGLMSPLMGPYQYNTFGQGCNAISQTTWVFCHSAHQQHIDPAVGGADDNFALDCNRLAPYELGQEVFPVEDGWISHHTPHWNGNSVGQLLIRHVTNGKTWYSGYLHMTNITSNHLRRPG